MVCERLGDSLPLFDFLGVAMYNNYTSTLVSSTPKLGGPIEANVKHQGKDFRGIDKAI